MGEVEQVTYGELARRILIRGLIGTDKSWEPPCGTGAKDWHRKDKIPYMASAAIEAGMLSADADLDAMHGLLQNNTVLLIDDEQIAVTMCSEKQISAIWVDGVRRRTREGNFYDIRPELVLEGIEALDRQTPTASSTRLVLNPSTENMITATVQVDREKIRLLQEADLERIRQEKQAEKAAADENQEMIVHAQKSAEGLVAAGTKLLALDFDWTMVQVHTGGSWRKGAQALSEEIRPVFRYLVPAAIERGITVAVTTCSHQMDLVKEVVQVTYGELASRILIRGLIGTDKSWEPPCGTGAKDWHRKDKIPYMASAAIEAGMLSADADLDAMHGLLQNNTVLLIDDEQIAVTMCSEKQISAIWVDGVRRRTREGNFYDIRPELVLEGIEALDRQTPTASSTRLVLNPSTENMITATVQVDREKIRLLQEADLERIRQEKQAEK